MRYLRFARWLDQLHDTSPVREVVFEEVRRHLGVDAAHVYGGMLGTLTAWCEARAIPYRGIPVGTIKKHVTGRGNASKGEMIAAIRAQGFQAIDDNEADAVAVLLVAVDSLQLGPEEGRRFGRMKAGSGALANMTEVEEHDER